MSGRNEEQHPFFHVPRVPLSECRESHSIVSPNSASPREWVKVVLREGTVSNLQGLEAALKERAAEWGCIESEAGNRRTSLSGMNTVNPGKGIADFDSLAYSPRTALKQQSR